MADPSCVAIIIVFKEALENMVMSKEFKPVAVTPPADKNMASSQVRSFLLLSFLPSKCIKKQAEMRETDTIHAIVHLRNEI